MLENDVEAYIHIPESVLKLVKNEDEGKYGIFDVVSHWRATTYLLVALCYRESDNLFKSIGSSSEGGLELLLMGSGEKMGFRFYQNAKKTSN